MIDASFVYLFCIELKNAQEYYLTSSSYKINFDGKIYIPFSGLSFLSGQFNDTAQNKIILHGVFEEKGISSDQDLVDSRIKIINFENKIANELVTYHCTEQISDGLEFKLVCKSEVTKLNQSLLPVFSRTCRANFCDKDCNLDINDFKVKVSVINIEGDSFLCEDLSIYKSNYFSGGRLFVERNDLVYEYPIKSHFANKIEVYTGSNLNIKDISKVFLSPSCDKKIRTCCYSFNNAVNFRGEPDIPENKIIKN